MCPVPIPENARLDASGNTALHLSAALAGIVVLVFLEYRINSDGYMLSRSCWVATDSLIWILMGLVDITLTAFIFLSAYIWEADGDNPCMVDPRGPDCSTRLAFVPWILNGVFLWWFLRHTIHRIHRVLLRLYSFAVRASAGLFD